MKDARVEALKKLAESEDLSNDEYLKLLRKQKQDRINRIISNQQEDDYFEGVDEAEMQVNEVIDENVPLEDLERAARIARDKRKWGLK